MGSETNTKAAWDGTAIRPASCGPDWDAAEAYGLDMTLIEHSLAMSPAERAERLQHMLGVVAELRAAFGERDVAAADR